MDPFLAGFSDELVKTGVSKAWVRRRATSHRTANRGGGGSREMAAQAGGFRSKARGLRAEADRLRLEMGNAASKEKREHLRRMSGKYDSLALALDPTRGRGPHW